MTVMTSDPYCTEERQRKRTPLHRLGIGVIWLCVVGVLITWWRMPDSYYLAATAPVFSSYLSSCATGYLLQEEPERFALRDWETGESVWQVQAPLPNYEGRVSLGSFHSGYLYSVSPDGRTFAAVIPQGTETRVRVWRDGQQRGNLVIPEFPPHPPCVKALDNGRVFVWAWGGSACPAVAIENGRIVARGVFPDVAVLSVDGETLLAEMGRRLATVTVDGDRIRVRTAKLVTDPLLLHHGAAGLRPEESYVEAVSAVLFTRGMMMTNSGVKYGTLLGREPLDTTWEHRTNTPGGEYCLQMQGKRTARVYAPLTGESWQFDVPGRLLGGDAAVNGEFALVAVRPDASVMLRGVSDFVPQFSNMIRNQADPYLALYRQSGDLCATKQLRLGAHGGPVVLHRNVEKPLVCCMPSPDGKAMAMIVEGRYGYESMLYRW